MSVDDRTAVLEALIEDIFQMEEDADRREDCEFAGDPADFGDASPLALRILRTQAAAGNPDARAAYLRYVSARRAQAGRSDAPASAMRGEALRHAGTE